jgi:hypothetical protein
MASEKDVLFLLPPAFPDAKQGAGDFFCPDCVTVNGILAYHPHLRDRIEVKVAPFARPRQEVIALLGPDHQGCPVLVLPEEAPAESSPVRRSITGRQFVAGAMDIGDYLARKYGTPVPHR